MKSIKDKLKQLVKHNHRYSKDAAAQKVAEKKKSSLHITDESAFHFGGNLIYTKTDREEN